MSNAPMRRPPGQVRDAILRVLADAPGPLPVADICERVGALTSPVPRSSVQSYLSLNTPRLFTRTSRGRYRRATGSRPRILLFPTKPEMNGDAFQFGRATLFHVEALHWLGQRAPRTIHGVVTDPPYGLHEYSPSQQQKLRNGKGGVWRIPPSFDGHRRSPVPRFTTLSAHQLRELEAFFHEWALALRPGLVPGAHVFLASTPLLSFLVAGALARAGLERRGEIIRLTTTLRGGDRPKGAHREFSDVSVMPRSMWEPWLLFREPLEGRVRDNLRKWKTGALRRPATGNPFGDVIRSAPTRKTERTIAPHPSLKPQAFLRQVVRAALPLGEGVVLDPFAGSGSTLAAAEAVGYESIGLEHDPEYFAIARHAMPGLTRYAPPPTRPAHRAPLPRLATGGANSDR